MSKFLQQMSVQLPIVNSADVQAGLKRLVTKTFKTKRTMTVSAAAYEATFRDNLTQIFSRSQRHTRSVISCVEQRFADLEVKCAHKPCSGRSKVGGRVGHASCS